MIETSVEIVRLEGHDPELPLPHYATDGAAGMDICANLAPEFREQGMEFSAGERGLVPTGLAFKIPEGFEIQMRPRSGLALKHGLTLLNSPGTIDSDYRGQVGIILINLGTEPFVVHHGMRIAQMVLAPVPRMNLVTVAAINDTQRGTGGFGSTGSASGPAGRVAPC